MIHVHQLFSFTLLKRHEVRKNRIRTNASNFKRARTHALLLGCCVLIGCIFIHIMHLVTVSTDIFATQHDAIVPIFDDHRQQSSISHNIDLSYIQKNHQLRKDAFVQQMNNRIRDDKSVEWYSLSIIVVTRNNQYLGDSISRFLHFLQQLVLYNWQWNNNNTKLNSNSIEVIVVEYNNDPSLPNLRDLPQFSQLQNQTKITVRWLNIDQNMHQEIIEHEWLHNGSYNKLRNNDDPFLPVEYDFYKNCKILEFIAKNIAARRSSNDMLLFTTSDMIFPIKLLKFLNFNLNSKFIKPKTLILTTRDMITQQQLIELNTNESNIDFFTQFDSVQCPCVLEVNETTSASNIDDSITDIQNIFGFSSQLTSCNGDFHLVFRKDFTDAFGYSQAPTVWSVDSDFCNRVRFLYNFTTLELRQHYKLKHQWHELHDGSSLPKHGKNTCNLLKSRKTDSWRFEAYVKHYFENGSDVVRDDKNAKQFFQQKTPHSFYIKKENWGLPKLKVPQTVWYSKSA